MKVPFFTLVLMSFVLSVTLPGQEAYASGKKRFTVIVDAGHGGKDAGATGSKLKLKEKNVNLSVALELGRLLYEEKGVRIIFTRKTDVFIPLDERAAIANKEKADLFISIHANAAKSRSAFGTETYVVGSSSKENLQVAMQENASILYEDNYKSRYGGFDPNRAESYIMFDLMQSSYLSQSIQLAQLVQRNFVKTCDRSDRSVKQAGFLVLKQTNMPGVLVELGYLSNAKEEKYLNKEKSRKLLAKAIFDAVMDYKEGLTKMSQAYEEENDEKEVKKEEVETKEPEVVSNVDEKKSVSDSVIYSVQFCSSKTQKSLNSRDFKSCVPAVEYQENGIFKYMYGKTTSFLEALDLQKKVREDFSDAFVVVLKDNKKLPPSEAFQYLK
ncbi:MAG: N-acetylmuramoyl-L-alanine amidase [Paludibacteraceae bacterium]|nr:N-acetylmuramoyl-L-alanine amidase [Paludibacteraceae bacterium]